LRDGQLSLWASNMRTGMMLPVAERFDRAGFEAVEIMSSAFYKKCVRDLKDDPWERVRLLARRIKKTLIERLAAQKERIAIDLQRPGMKLRLRRL
jgi:pyruvate/oxaloacetate carboxyltransferase